MILERRSFGRGSVRVETTPTTLRVERFESSSRHSFEIPLSQISLTVEKWEGTAFLSYVAAGVCAAVPAVSQWLDPDLSLPGLFWQALAIWLAVYYFRRGRARSGSYFIVRNSRDVGREIWILRSGAEAEVDGFMRDLRSLVARNQEAPNKAAEPPPTVGSS